MSHRRRPSHRKAPNPKASWLVLGRSATPILHEGRTAHLLPFDSRHHVKRYSPGQRLAVKEYVPGPTACHVIVTEVLGPASTRRFYLGHVDYAIARELGFVRLDDFHRAWLVNYDQEWLGRAIEEGRDTPEKCSARFEQRWSTKLGWLLRFRLDHAAAPRLLAARSDELYVENEAMALQGEMPALRADEWEVHVGPKSRYREQDRLAAKRAERDAKGVHERLAEARRAAKAKGADVRDECRRFDRLTEQGKHEKALRQLVLIEARVYPAAA